MPELPEVEVTRLSFADRIAGATIVLVAVGKPLRWPLGCTPEKLVGQQVLQVRRRGKYLLLDLSEGLLLIHLGMSGSLAFGKTLMAVGKHDHFDMVTNQGTLRLNDPRRFGAVVYAASEADPIAAKLLGHLGVEPLSEHFDAALFHAALKVRQTAIKHVLLSGSTVVGLGNIYVSEALFMAGIRPTAKASSLSKTRTANLHAAIQKVLLQAVAQGGSTLRNFSNASGHAGNFQLEAKVYNRAGLPCLHCAAPIRKIVQGQRATFYCSNCQKS